ncbi:MAG: hypothetical protein U5K37_12170 [Natrialbaceae archaeon]|nr:hypothetical protein [Natrialbaceae archaeon]
MTRTSSGTTSRSTLAKQGLVVKVGVRSTTLMMRDEVLVTVPNSVLNAAKVINQSAPRTASA